jgi:hypothetical protein
VYPVWSPMVAPRVYSPRVSTTTLRWLVSVATAGSSATAIAIGSGRSKPARPVAVSADSVRTAWMSTAKSPRRPAVRRSAEAAASKVAYLREMSQPTMASRAPEPNTIAAASGSTQMLNSAAAVMFPTPSPVPPIISISRRRAAYAGWRANNTAM